MSLRVSCGHRGGDGIGPLSALSGHLTAENQDVLPNHQSIDLWRNHHGSVRSGEAQPNLRS
jgi:hypothetical protein